MLLKVLSQGFGVHKLINGHTSIKINLQNKGSETFCFHQNLDELRGFILFAHRFNLLQIATPKRKGLPSWLTTSRMENTRKHRSSCKCLAIKHSGNMNLTKQNPFQVYSWTSFETKQHVSWGV